MASGSLIARWPLLAAMAFEGMLIPLALLLALVVGVQPWTEFALTGSAILIALAATAPLILMLIVLSRLHLPACRQLEDWICNVLSRLFAHARPGAIVLVALLAGFGEELLFRGVLQAWLALHLDAAVAIVVVALLFGMAHWVNTLYLVVATGMGLYLGVIYHWTGSLLVVSLIHALYDWVAIHFYLRRMRATTAA